METKKLRRSLKDSVIGGVSGGLGEYFGTDPVIFRILFIVLTFTGGGGVLIYLLMWIFIPKAEIDYDFFESKSTSANEKTEANDNAQEPKAEPFEPKSKGFKDDPFAPKEKKKPMDPETLKRRKNGNLIGGALLIMIGMFFLADDFFPWLSWEYLWPAALIIAGLAIIKVNYNNKKLETDQDGKS